MAKIVLEYEAVRYLACKAVFGKNEDALDIVMYLTYNKRGAGFKNLLVNPYNRVADSPRALAIISNTISKAVGDAWYLLVTTDEGIKHISKCLRGSSSELAISPEVCTEEYALDVFKRAEFDFRHEMNC